jgi:hypothetical protein
MIPALSAAFIFHPSFSVRRGLHDSEGKAAKNEGRKMRQVFSFKDHDLVSLNSF